MAELDCQGFPRLTRYQLASHRPLHVLHLALLSKAGAPIIIVHFYTFYRRE